MAKDDLPPEAPSFITRVCGSGSHIPGFRFGQARPAQSLALGFSFNSLFSRASSPAGHRPAN